MEELTEEPLDRDEVFKKVVDETFKRFDSVLRALAKSDTEPHYSDYSLLRQREGYKVDKQDEDLA